MANAKKTSDITSIHPHHKPRRVKITVDRMIENETHGKCHMHTVGEVFNVDFERCPQNFCAAAWHALWPSLRVVELGGRHPWDAVKGVTYVGCPDPNIPVVFKIETFEAD